MSEQETMRLVAEVVDKYSGPLKNMMEQLKKIGEGSKKVHSEGKKHVDDHHKSYHELREQMKKVKETTTDSLRPAFNALGISVLSVSAAIASVSESVKSFGEYGEKLEFAHRASGLLQGSVRGLAEANQKYGVSTEDTIKSLEQFGAHMDELHRKSPAYINAWKALGGNAWNEIGSPLAKLDGRREEQLKKAMEIVPKIRDVDQRRRVLALLGLPENWAYLTDHEMQEMQKKASDFNKRFPFSAENAHAAKEAWDELLSTFRGLRDEMAGEFAPGFTSGLKGLNEILHSEEWKSFKTNVQEIGKWFSSWNIGSLKTDLKDIQWFLEKYGQLRDFLKKDHSLFPAKPSSGTSDSQENQKTQENIKEGTRKGLEEFFQSLKMQQQSGMYMPMAYHPGGGSIGGSGGGGSAPKFGSSEFPLVGGGGGNTRGDRNNNPGNLKMGDVARAFGAVGADDRGFAIFPNRESGAAAQEALVKSDRYKGLSLRQFASKYAEGSPDWMRTVGGAMGIGANDVVNNQDPRLIDAIRRAEGTGRGTGDFLRGAGRANYMSGQHGGIGQNLTTIRTAGGRTFTANAASAPYLKGFVEDLERGGAPINSIGGYNPRHIAGTNKWSQHAYGNALDIDQHSRGVTSKAFADWARANPEKLNAAVKKWGIINGASFGDWGHFEWGGTGGEGARIRDMVRRGRGGPRDPELLRRGMKSDSDLSGNAKLTIDLNGFPKGTQTSHSADGIFKEVTLNRGRPMLQSSEYS